MGKMPHEQRSCAFFDIDGTLLEGFMIQSFPRYLANLALIDDTYADRIDDIISNYHHGKVAYREAAETVPHLYALALKGKSVNSVRNWAKEFVRGYLPRHLFSYSLELVRNVGDLVDMTIALSGSPLEVVEELEELGFDRIFGSLFELKEGVYSGRVSANLILGEEKAEFARHISKELDIDLKRSIAFGDTDQDEPLLGTVGLPIGMNPNQRLREICESRGWKWLGPADLAGNGHDFIEWLKTKASEGRMEP